MIPFISEKWYAKMKCQNQNPKYWSILYPEKIILWRKTLLELLISKVSG